LVELLVVITIIGILVSLLLPAVQAARGAARSMDCKNNLKNLALATQMYAETHGRYPAAWIVGLNTIASPSLGWCGAYYVVGTDKIMDVTQSPLWPYLQVKQILRCPCFEPEKVKYPTSGQISGYGINSQYVAGDPGDPAILDPTNATSGMIGYKLPASIPMIHTTHDTILFADCAGIKKANGYSVQNTDMTTPAYISEEFFVYPLRKEYGADTIDLTLPAKNYPTFHFHHAGLANAAFCDGHVESISPLELDPRLDGVFGWMPNERMDRE
jgi:prepilin-type processing-associated H-X9-DG protein